MIFGTAPVVAEKRVALVIGNAGYAHTADLKNPKNDARAVAAALTRLGFDVEAAYDVTLGQFNKALAGFAQRAAGADFAVVYYAGHGTSIDKVNYLIPVDAPLQSIHSIDFETVPLDKLVQAASVASGIRLVIMDACRNDIFGKKMQEIAAAVAPGGRKRDVSRGFSRPLPATGMLIGFSAADGTQAADGKGRHSPYTAALLKHIETPGLELNLLFRKVRDQVLETTGGNQAPKVYSDLPGRSIFLKEQQAVEKPVAASPANSIEQDYAAAAAIGTKQAWEAFLSVHGKKQDNLRVLLAKAALQKLAVGVFEKPDPVPVTPKAATCTGIETTVAAKKQCLQHKQTFRDCPTCPEMVVIPPGKFMMGSPKSEKDRQENEGPRREVTIGKAFAVGKFEVTVDQFSAFVKETGYKVGDSCWTYESDDWQERQGRSYLKPGFEQSGSHPAACLSWNDAQAYVKWLNRKTGQTYRLLSEAEWEYAARAGTQTPFSTGEWITTDQANFNGNFTYNGSRKGTYRGRTVAVGSFAANAFGLHDMHGNEWEWIADCYKDSHKGAPNDGTIVATKSCDSRVLRGGSWYDGPRDLRSANRGVIGPDFRGISSGFRLSRTLTS